MMGSTVREGTVDPYKNKPNSALESAALSHLHATEYNYVIRLIQKRNFFCHAIFYVVAGTCHQAFRVVWLTRVWKEACAISRTWYKKRVNVCLADRMPDWYDPFITPSIYDHVSWERKFWFSACWQQWWVDFTFMHDSIWSHSTKKYIEWMFLLFCE